LSVVWSGVQQTVVDDEETDKWRLDNQVCARAKECHFEHLFKIEYKMFSANIFTLNG